MNIKLNENEVSALIDLLELDTCTDVAETNWEMTTCATSDLTKDQAYDLYAKLFTLHKMQLNQRAKKQGAA